MGFADALAAIETAWSLQGAGFRVIALSRAGRRPPLRHVRGVELYEVPAPEHDARATVRAVEQLVRRLEPDALLPLDDQSVWVFNELGDLDVVVAGPTGAAAELALDKSLQVAAALRAGLAVPDTHVLHDPREFGRVDAPVIVKAARPVSEVDGGLARPTAVVCANNRRARGRCHEGVARPGPGSASDRRRGRGRCSDTPAATAWSGGAATVACA